MRNPRTAAVTALLLVLCAASPGAQELRYLDGKFGLLLTGAGPRASDAAGWVRIARAAGARHIAVDADTTSGAGLRELAEACRRDGLPLGFRCRPRSNGDPLDALRAAVARAGAAAVVGLAGGGAEERLDAAELYRRIRELQPGVLVTDSAPPYGDFRTIEDELPLRVPTKRSGARVFTEGANALAPPIAPLHWKFQPWELRGSIGAKPARDLVRELAAVAARGGSLLLAVDAREDTESRLRGVGRWLAVHGESIYGTTYGPLQNVSWARTTATERAIYVQVFDWPRGVAELDGFRWKATGVRFLGRAPALRFEQRGGRLAVTLPEREPDALLSVLRIDVDGPVYDPADFEPPATSGTGSASAPKSAPPKAPAPPRTERIEFVAIPPGEFLMGSTLAPDERPPHRVRITHGFEVGRDEVTQAQWRAVMGANPSAFPGPDRPVEMVSWNDVQQFLQKMNARNDGYRYRLPTEAEWEYAARAGAAGDYAVDLDTAAWHNGNSGGETHEVGQKEPNAWGLYDLHGNVWEWCQDWYDSGYYAASPSVDPPGPASGTGKALRGGSWFNNVRIARPSCRGRGGSGPDVKGNHIGFRCVREPAARAQGGR